MDEISAILLTVVGHCRKAQHIYHNRYNEDGRKEEKHNIIIIIIIIIIMGGLEGCKQSWEALKDKILTWTDA